jgi:hypothetical protein
MAISLLRLLGERVAHKTIAQNSRIGGLLDIKLGFAMLKDRRVPFRTKLLAVGAGAGLIALLIGLQMPLEWFLAIVLPVIGLVADVLTDGFEAVIGTLGVAALLLPHIAPKALTQQIRNERAGIIEEPVAVIAPTAPALAAPVRPAYDLPQPTQKLIYPQS